MSASRAGSDRFGAGLLLTLAAVTTRLLLSGEYLAYVRPTMAPFLALTVVFLVVIGGWTLLSSRSAAQERGSHPATAWLLLWPVLVLLVVAPGRLGAFSAERAAAEPPPRGTTVNGFLPLPAGDPAELSLEDYDDRSLYGGASTLAGRRVAVLGFVSRGPAAEAWYVTRLEIRCCAADALPVRVLAVGARPPPTDQWVRVTGPYLQATAEHVARLQVETVEEVAPPTYPYVYG